MIDSKTRLGAPAECGPPLTRTSAPASVTGNIYETSHFLDSNTCHDPTTAMSAVDFAAAQERILARRAARLQAQQQSFTPATPPPSALLALPAPLRDLALSSISAFDRLRSPYGTRPAFRVGQVDAELLDEELLTLFKGQVGDGLKYFGSHLADDYAVEILTALRLALWKFSIWDRGVSYGGHLQGLKYVDARSKGEKDP